MKITIETTYENVDEEWFEEWLNAVGSTPGLDHIRDELIECNHAVYISKDPTSEVVGTTKYWIGI